MVNTQCARVKEKKKKKGRHFLRPFLLIALLHTISVRVGSVVTLDYLPLGQLPPTAVTWNNLFNIEIQGGHI